MTKVLRGEIASQRAQFLAMARIERLRAITVDEMMARYGGTRKQNEYELTIALQRRAAE